LPADRNPALYPLPELPPYFILLKLFSGKVSMNQRILSIEYIRGLAMLGVVGIHTGSELLSNPQANIHLFAVLEIVSRFSVPIFFFVSAFSLFHQYPLDGPFDAGRFYRPICPGAVALLIGSVLYMLHYSWLPATGASGCQFCYQFSVSAWPLISCIFW
jgi:peptidoglycan/LPS O-acetylase OafA/YrhL